MTDSFRKKLVKKLGTAAVMTSPAPEFASDKWFAKGSPELVVFPKSTEETAFGL